MINMYVKFNVHSSYAKQVTVLKVADRPTDEQMRLVTTIGIRQNFGRGIKREDTMFFGGGGGAANSWFSLVLRISLRTFAHNILL